MNPITTNWIVVAAAPAATDAPASALTGTQTLQAIGILAVVIAASGAIIVWARRTTPNTAQRSVNASVVRSWLAIVLVTGLLIFCAYAFSINDSSLRSTLVGALAASTGTVVAYYFASKSSDQARQDILHATFGTDTIPDLLGSTETEATTTMSRTSFRLEVDPAARPATDTATVAFQHPPGSGTVVKGATVTVGFSPAASK
ncbi:PASTA domain-containing protein [Amycolatopsis sp. NPDC049252]|uniref:PASTA domain-containing protein n=1 Tax=Amycolatopsis sp. NPDC049252 TaxID=3363933 RepID=UPI00371DFB85